MTQVKTMNTLVKGLQVAAAVSIAVLAANPAYAAIVGGWSTVSTRVGPVGTLDINLLDTPPSRIKLNTIESQQILAFNEKQNVTLSENVLTSDGFNTSTGVQDILIPAGTFVSSHFLFADPPVLPGEPLWKSRHFWEGEITFDNEIIGIVAQRGSIPKSSTLLGLEDVDYSGLSRSGLDKIAPSNVVDIVSFEGNTLSFRISTAHLGLDPMRVITYANQATPVPEPLTLLGTSTALGFIPLLKRAYSKKQKKTKKKS
jgi:hypothetical protein